MKQQQKHHYHGAWSHVYCDVCDLGDAHLTCIFVICVVRVGHVVDMHRIARAVSQTHVVSELNPADSHGVVGKWRLCCVCCNVTF